MFVNYFNIEYLVGDWKERELDEVDNLDRHVRILDTYIFDL